MASRMPSETELVPARESTMYRPVDVGDVEKGLRGPVAPEGVPVIGGGIEEKLEAIEEIKGKSAEGVERDVADISRR